MVTTFDVINTFDLDGNIVIKTGIQAINEALRTLLLTTRSEVLGEPGFGSKLQELDKTNITGVLVSILEDDIISAINTIDTRIQVDSVEIKRGSDASKCMITISYIYESEYAAVNIDLINKGDY